MITPLRKKCHAAVIQAAPVVWSLERSLAKLADLTADAARRGANLVVFPEAFLSGYPKGLDFGARVGMRAPEGREDFRRYFESAIEVPSEESEYLGDVAGKHRVELVVGAVEREGGTLYCTVLFYGSDGTLRGKHRKVMPTAMERLVWGFGDGSTLSVFDTAYGRLGSVICWENYMPLLRMAMYSKGVQLYCAPTADSRPTWVATMQHVALEGRCFVLSSCQYLTRVACPSDFRAIQGDHPETVLMEGGSCIVGPLGQLLAGPVFNEECILAAELDLDEITRAKFNFDVVGHYARPDIFQLRVNEKSNPAVVFEAHEVGARELSVLDHAVSARAEQKTAFGIGDCSAG
jgi:nitrilase